MNFCELTFPLTSQKKATELDCNAISMNFSWKSTLSLTTRRYNLKESHKEGRSETLL